MLYPPLVKLDAFMVREAFGLLALCAIACGSNGLPGPPGPVGPPAAGCPGLSPGQTPGVKASISVSTPSNAQFFATGEQPVLTIYFVTNQCGQLIQPPQLTVAQLMVYGPRDPLQTVTNVDLLLNSPVV